MTKIVRMTSLIINPDGLDLSEQLSQLLEAVHRLLKTNLYYRFGVIMERRKGFLLNHGADPMFYDAIATRVNNLTECSGRLA